MTSCITSLSEGNSGCCCNPRTVWVIKQEEAGYKQEEADARDQGWVLGNVSHPARATLGSAGALDGQGSGMDGTCYESELPWRMGVPGISNSVVGLLGRKSGRSDLQD